jgi:hypothetical protein
MSCIKSVLALLAVCLVTLMQGAAFAHKPSDSYLKLDVEGATITGQWDIALRDLDFALGLDSNQDNAITWGEVKAKHSEIAAYALSRLTLGPAEARCAPDMREHLIDNHSDGAYAVLRFAATCPAAPAIFDVDYRLFFEIDPQHRGLLNLSSHGANRAGIFSVDQPVQHFTLAEFSKSAAFADYLKEGVLHIWSGFDHILFLLSLLLPAVLVRPDTSGEAWVASPGFRASFLGVLKVVTAFTVAHSITLSLATLGVISLPSRLVESAIAASVVLAAINNIRPVVYGGRWILAFAFGLIHGFGFASVLTDLGLPQGSLLLALVAFNLGVEVGQLAIVALFLPLAFAARDTLFYRRAILVGGSSCVAMIAALWLVQRALNVVLLPGFGS